MLRWIALAAALLTACRAGSPAPVAAPSPTNTVPVIPPATSAARPSPTVAAEAASSFDYDGRWRTIAPGLELLAVTGRAGQRQELLLVLRVDPAQRSLRVRYAPDAPRSVREWLDDSGAVAAVNAAYFLENRRTAALLIADGVVHGRTYSGFGGMFALRDGVASLHWLRRTPYTPDASIRQAVQSVPMLVEDGAVVPGIPDNGERNRRTFVALDRRGMVLLGVSQTAAWTLTDLAAYLAAEPLLDARAALNLDGGASSGLWLRADAAALLTNSLDRVPSVITVE
jgi:hypothetical protein